MVEFLFTGHFPSLFLISQLLKSPDLFRIFSELLLFEIHIYISYTNSPAYNSITKNGGKRMKELNNRKFLGFTAAGATGTFIGVPMLNCGKYGSCELFGRAS